MLCGMDFMSMSERSEEVISARESLSKNTNRDSARIFIYYFLESVFGGWFGFFSEGRKSNFKTKDI